LPAPNSWLCEPPLRAGLYGPRSFSRRELRRRCWRRCLDRVERRAASDFLQPRDGAALNGLGGKERLGVAAWRARFAVGCVGVDESRRKGFRGTPLIGGYAVDNEGVRAQRVTLSGERHLKSERCRARPGPDSDQSNGHGRAGFLNEAKPNDEQSLLFLGGNVFRGGVEKEISGHLPRRKAGLMPRRARNGQSRTGLLTQENLRKLLAATAAGAGTGDRLPLVVSASIRKPAGKR